MRKIFGFLMVLILSGCGAGARTQATTKAHGVAVCSLGTNWSTVDDYVYHASQSEAPTSLAADASGNVFESSIITTSAGSHWLVRKGAAGGTTWSNLDDYVYPDATNASAVKVLVDAKGNLNVAGYGDDSSPDTHWLVRRSPNGGHGWSTTDDYVYPGGRGLSRALGLALGAGGEIFAIGAGYAPGPGASHWVVRTSTGGGTGWSANPVDDYVYDGVSASGEALVNDGQGNLFGVGQGSDSKGRSHWLVRKSSDGGNHWSTSPVDDFRYHGDSDAEAGGAVADASGNLYVVGQAQVSGIGHWLVRKGTSAGQNWATVDDDSDPALSAQARVAAVDRAGNVYVAGYVGSRWVVRKSLDHGASWTDFDHFVPPGGSSGAASAMTFDAAGDLLVGGMGIVNGTFHAYVRRLACQ